MLPSSKKLHKSEFPPILKGGKVIHSPHLYARVIPSDNLKLAFVVPKRAIKGAILRNKIKRKGYNILKDQEIKPIKAIFFAKKGVEKLTFPKLEEEILDILSKVVV